MTTPDLVGRTAVVTGGASGIGRAIVLGLAARGARVAVLDVNTAGVDELVATAGTRGARLIGVACDVASATSVEAAARAVKEALGPVHILVNSHGISGFGTLPDLAEAEWLRMIDVHLNGVFRTCRAFVGDMIAVGWGRIVNVSSVGGLRGGPMLVHYAAAKAGVIGFTKALAIDVGPQGITVNAIAPGLVDTPMLRASGIPDAVRDTAIAAMPIRRLGTPEDVAAVCQFLVSEQAAWFTGQVLSPNGGAHL